jgi:hypothetical protein
MIPTIGIMIGGYILLRALDITCRRDDSFSSNRSRILMLLCSALLMVVTVFEMMALLVSGESVPRVP